MLDPAFVFVGAAIGLAGAIQYAIATLRGRVAPNRVTWALWAAAPLIGFFAQLDSGVGLTAVLTLSVGVGPLLVLVSSFFGRASPPRITGFDILCGAISIAALIVWLLLDQPVLAVVFAVLADGAGAVPTLRKAWRHPRSESSPMYLCTAANGTIALLTVQTWTVENWVFPAYIAALGVTLAAIVILRGRRVLILSS